tara:strand:+ start:232 stop:645 length:414 start_codon:yes stop_codon:yes gene_type:complete
MATHQNLIVDQGSHWSANVTVYTSNSTGQYSANLYQYANGAGQIRKSHSTSANGTNATANLVVDIHPAGSGNTGTITLSMNSATTGGITAGRYVYDVEIVGGPAVVGYSSGDENNKILRAVEGIVTITPQVTTWDWS